MGSQEMLMDQAMLRTVQNKSPTSTAYSSKSNVRKTKKLSNLSHTNQNTSNKNMMHAGGGPGSGAQY